MLALQKSPDRSSFLLDSFLKANSIDRTTLYQNVGKNYLSKSANVINSRREVYSTVGGTWKECLILRPFLLRPQWQYRRRPWTSEVSWSTLFALNVQTETKFVCFTTTSVLTSRSWAAGGLRKSDREMKKGGQIKNWSEVGLSLLFE